MIRCHKMFQCFPYFFPQYPTLWNTHRTGGLGEKMTHHPQTLILFKYLKGKLNILIGNFRCLLLRPNGIWTDCIFSLYRGLTHFSVYPHILGHYSFWPLRLRLQSFGSDEKLVRCFSWVESWSSFYFRRIILTCSTKDGLQGYGMGGEFIGSRELIRRLL